MLGATLLSQAQWTFKVQGARRNLSAVRFACLSTLHWHGHVVWLKKEGRYGWYNAPSMHVKCVDCEHMNPDLAWALGAYSGATQVYSNEVTGCTGNRIQCQTRLQCRTWLQFKQDAMQNRMHCKQDATQNQAGMQNQVAMQNPGCKANRMQCKTGFAVNRIQCKTRLQCKARLQCAKPICNANRVQCKTGCTANRMQCKTRLQCKTMMQCNHDAFLPSLGQPLKNAKNGNDHGDNAIQAEACYWVHLLQRIMAVHLPSHQAVVACTCRWRSFPPTNNQSTQSLNYQPCDWNWTRSSCS